MVGRNLAGPEGGNGFVAPVGDSHFRCRVETEQFRFVLRGQEFDLHVAREPRPFAQVAPVREMLGKVQLARFLRLRFEEVAGGGGVAVALAGADPPFG